MTEDRKRKPAMERRRFSIGSDPRADARREQADERAEARALRTAEEQIVRLDSRPGQATRERARLLSALRESA